MEIIKSAIPFILICFGVIFIPILSTFLNKKTSKTKKSNSKDSPLANWNPLNEPGLPPSPNYVSWTQTQGIPSDSTAFAVYVPTPGLVQWTSSHGITEDQIMQETAPLLKDIQEKVNKDPVKLKTRFELLRE